MKVDKCEFTCAKINLTNVQAFCERVIMDMFGETCHHFICFTALSLQTRTSYNSRHFGLDAKIETV